MDKFEFKVVKLSHILFVLSLLFCFIRVSIQKHIQVPPITDLTDQYIRLNEIQQIKEPNINLNKVYRRQVYKVQNDSIQNFQVCKQQSPQISFKNIGYYRLPMENASSNANPNASFNNQRVIYQFDKLKNKLQNVLDMYFFDDNIFTISSQGNINIYKLNGNYDNGIELRKSIKAIDWIQLQNRKQKEADEKLKNNTDTSNDKNASNTTKDGDKTDKNSTNSTNNTDTANNQQNTNTTNDSTEQDPIQNSTLPQSNNNTIQNDQMPPKVTLSSQQSSIQKENVNEQNNRQNNYFRLLAQQRQQKQKNSSNTNSSSLEQDKTQNKSEVVVKPYLNMGYFISLQNNQILLFCNDLYTILINVRTFQTSLIEASNESYQESQKFQTVVKIDENHFATLDRQYGVNIYQIIKDKNSTQNKGYKISFLNAIKKKDFGNTYEEQENMSLVDMAFDSKRKILFVLDEQKGVFSLDQQTVKTVNTQQLTFKLSYYTILKRMCNLMVYSQIQQNLYLSCNKIYKISIAQWPRIQQKVYSHPLINIREIYIQQKQNLIVLAGYSVFKVLYLDRTTSYFQDDMLDKIIFHNGIAITANQNHIIALKYEIDKPTIICQTSNVSYLGLHNLMLKTTAQCNLSYLKSVGFNSSSQPLQNDTCIYIAYKNVYIWQKGEVPIKPLSIILLTLTIFLVVMMIWFVLVKFRMFRARQQLRYLSEEGHKQLVEEDLVKSEVFSQPQTSEQSCKKEDIRTQQEPNKELYSIQ